jgi:integrase
MGYIYRKKRKRRDGSIYVEPIWQLKFYRDGEEIRESSGTDDYNEAATTLKLREGTIAKSEPLIPSKIRFSEMLDVVIQDYDENDRKDLSHTESRIKNHIRPFFGSKRPSDITSTVLAQYRAIRKAQGASNGTINRELSIIGKAFTLSDLSYRPKIKKLKETNIRTGFVTRKQIESIKKHLPPDVADLIEFLFLTGWRKSEVMRLHWNNINFDRLEVTLEAFTTKNDQPRCFPMFSDLLQLLKRRRVITDEVEKRRRIIIPWVFHRNGYQIRDFRASWEIATKKAKLSGTLIHDLRRSAIKIFTENGISEQMGMMLAGHRTPSIYRRYNIITQDDLKKAVKNLESDSRGTIRGTISDSAAKKS